MVPLNYNLDNNPPPPKGPPKFQNKGNSTFVPKYNMNNNMEFDFISEM